MREKTIEKWLREGCDRLGLLAMKFTSPGNDGVPDRLVICPDGRALFVELKTDTGRLSPIQAWQHKRMRIKDLGKQRVFVRRSGNGNEGGR